MNEGVNFDADAGGEDDVGVDGGGTTAVRMRAEDPALKDDDGSSDEEVTFELAVLIGGITCVAYGVVTEGVEARLASLCTNCAFGCDCGSSGWGEVGLASPKLGVRNVEDISRVLRAAEPVPGGRRGVDSDAPEPEADMR
jgi:hypothetical protein